MNAAHLLAPPVRRWACPNCDTTSVTRESAPHTRYHPCSGLAGMLAPMLEDGVRAKVIAMPREDYVGGDDVRYDDDGRAIMSVVTIRDDGMDCAVMAPTATATARSLA
jgi:hypothetical protein